MLGPAQLLELAQRRNQRMLGLADALRDDLEIDLLDLRMRRDVARGVGRNDAAFGLLERQRRFDIEPFLHPVLVREDAAHLVRAPEMAQQDRVEDAGWHGSSPAPHWSRGSRA